MKDEIWSRKVSSIGKTNRPFAKKSNRQIANLVALNTKKATKKPRVFPGAKSMI
jgi:hypothetical protein